MTGAYSATRPLLSLVIPVYNGAPFIRENLELLRDYLTNLAEAVELIIVDDKSTDQTLSEIAAVKDLPFTLIKHEVNGGKFAALKTGMAKCSGACSIFIDSDLPFDLSALGYIRDQIVDRKIHIVIGDRTLPDSDYHALTTLPRKIATAVFSLFVRALVTGGLFDTQCGMKGFRTDVAKLLFPLVTDNRFAGDVELLYIALKYNLEIKRIPVRLVRSGPSTVSLLRHSIEMLSKIAKLKLRWLLGGYSSPELTELAAQHYWKAP